MSVTLQFKIEESNDCKSLTFRETTGLYDSVNNTSGWGTPNNATTDAETATLTITDPAGVVTTINLFTQGFPTNNIYQTYTILNTDLGLSSSASLSDGEWDFVYQVTRTTATAFDFSQTVKKLFYCVAKCCVFKMFADIPEDNECDCNSDDITKAEKARGFLQGLIYAANCGLVSKFNNLLTTINKLCKNQNCSSCGEKV